MNILKSSVSKEMAVRQWTTAFSNKYNRAPRKLDFLLTNYAVLNVDKTVHTLGWLEMKVWIRENIEPRDYWIIEPEISFMNFGAGGLKQEDRIIFFTDDELAMMFYLIFGSQVKKEKR